MSAEQFITEHLDLWTEAVTTKSASGRGRNGNIELTGIKKLRELILELAVRGQLVPQESSDESASYLLARIADERERLIKTGEIKQLQRLPKVDENDQRRLPPSWVWTRLGQATNYGLTEKAEPADVNANVWVLELEDIEKESSRLLTKVRQGQRPFKSSKNRFRKGDVLYGKLRPYLNKVIVADETGVCTTEIVPLRGFAGVNPEYLRLVLKSPAFKIYANSSTHGMNLPRLGTDKARLALLPLPPEREQHRIVQKVDELMALCDRLEQQTHDQNAAHETLVNALLDALTQSADADELADNWARLAAHFDALFTTEHSIDRLEEMILRLGVMGHLTSYDPNYESAPVLLSEMAARKDKLVKDGSIKKQKDSAAICGERKPFYIPEHWTWCRLPDVGIVARGKSKHRPRNDLSLYHGGTTPLIQTGDVARANRKINTYSALYNEVGVAQSKLWPAGTLCITIAANIGDTGILNFDACFPDSVVGFTPFDDSLFSEYFEYFLRTAKRTLEDFAPSTAQKNINLDVLQKIVVPLPPAEELKQVVERLDRLMALCDKLKTRLNQASKTRRQMADAVVEQALH